MTENEDEDEDKETKLERFNNRPLSPDDIPIECPYHGPNEVDILMNAEDEVEDRHLIPQPLSLAMVELLKVLRTKKEINPFDEVNLSNTILHICRQATEDTQRAKILKESGLPFMPNFLKLIPRVENLVEMAKGILTGDVPLADSFYHQKLLATWADIEEATGQNMGLLNRMNLPLSIFELIRPG